MWCVHMGVLHVSVCVRMHVQQGLLRGGEKTVSFGSGLTFISLKNASKNDVDLERLMDGRKEGWIEGWVCDKANTAKCSL